MNNSILLELGNLIESEELALKKYKTSANPKVGYIDLQSKRIEALNLIFNGLQHLNYFDYWLETEFLIKKILEQDPLVGEVMMFVGINPASRKSAHIINRQLY